MDMNGNMLRFNLGAVSPKGSYQPYYTNCQVATRYLMDNMSPTLTDIYNRFRIANPRKKTLFIRYNDKQHTLVVHTLGTMALASRIYYHG